MARRDTALYALEADPMRNRNWRRFIDPPLPQRKSPGAAASQSTRACIRRAVVQPARCGMSDAALHVPEQTNRSGRAKPVHLLTEQESIMYDVYKTREAHAWRKAGIGPRR